MLSRKNTLIWLVAVVLCFVGVASIKAGSIEFDYVVIDCYVDGYGNTWILWWDCRSDTTQWEVVAAVDTFLQIDGRPSESTDVKYADGTGALSCRAGGDKHLYMSSQGGDGRLAIETVPLPE